MTKRKLWHVVKSTLTTKSRDVLKGECRMVKEGNEAQKIVEQRYKKRKVGRVAVSVSQRSDKAQVCELVLKAEKTECVRPRAMFVYGELNSRESPVKAQREVGFVSLGPWFLWVNRQSLLLYGLSTQPTCLHAARL